tara:strand:- start:1996 stop:2355 length:360 start_codon:yes stop_codon:yes gene_type:complete
MYTNNKALCLLIAVFVSTFILGCSKTIEGLENPAEGTYVGADADPDAPSADAVADADPDAPSADGADALLPDADADASLSDADAKEASADAAADAAAALATANKLNEEEEPKTGAPKKI